MSGRSALAEVNRGGDSRRMFEDGGGWMDLQDRVFFFAGGIVVDVFCEMVHCGGDIEMLEY